jgi:hypothetical protein
MNRIGWLILLLLLVVIIGSPVFLVSRSLDDTPLVTARKVPSVDDAARAKAFGKKAQRTLFQPKAYPLVTVSQTEVDALCSFLIRGTSRVSSQVQINSSGMEVAFSLRLPDNAFGRFLNGQIRILPSSQGLKLDRVFIGKLQIPESLAIFWAKKAGDFVLGNQLGSVAMQSIQSVSFTERSVLVSVFSEPMEKLHKSLKGLHKGWVSVGDPDAIRFYYGQLAEIVGAGTGGNGVSLSTIMSPLFQVAKMRSQRNDPIAENRAAILALAMYFGSSRFEDLIGPVLTKELKASRRRNYPVVLAKRRDLRLHFIISAGLQLVADSGIGFAVGEFKELLDAGPGGSGFSFVDLAADRAGIHFAEVATGSPESARHFQQVLATGKGESSFFPDLADLPEGLQQGRFEGRYQDVQSSEYQRIVADIDQRIKKLPLFKTPSGAGN